MGIIGHELGAGYYCRWSAVIAPAFGQVAQSAIDRIATHLEVVELCVATKTCDGFVRITVHAVRLDACVVAGAVEIARRRVERIVEASPEKPPCVHITRSGSQSTKAAFLSSYGEKQPRINVAVHARIEQVLENTIPKKWRVRGEESRETSESSRLCDLQLELV